MKKFKDLKIGDTIYIWDARDQKFGTEQVRRLEAGSGSQDGKIMLGSRRYGNLFLSPNKSIEDKEPPSRLLLATDLIELINEVKTIKTKSMQKLMDDCRRIEQVLDRLGFGDNIIENLNQTQDNQAND